ncbi:MAG: hypothetical protein IJ156_08605 [Bacteroidales bacterium]|nr:hypothetical protein [Bacteroidales bacterium]
MPVTHLTKGKAREWFAMKEAAAAATPAPEKTSVFLRVDGSLRKVELSDILFVEGMMHIEKFLIHI